MRNVTSSVDQKIVDADIDSEVDPSTDPNTDADANQNLDSDSDSDATIRPDEANVGRPAGDDATLPPDRRDPWGGQPQPELTPSTDDRAAVLAPDDTFPGSGPLHPDSY